MIRSIRTISNLPRVPENGPSSGSLFEISYRAGDDTYTSKSYSINQMSSDMNNAISTSMTQQYNLSASEDKFSINTIVADVSALYKDDVGIDGKKTFSTPPALSTEQKVLTSDLDLVSFGAMRSVLEDENIYILPSLSVEDPLDNGYAKSLTSDEPDGFIRLSVDSHDYAASKTTATATMTKTGWLVMWGWLADTGDVAPEHAWVRLEAKVKSNSTGEEIWVPIAVQPWFVTATSGILQYVAFTVPVKHGLNIRVKAGFEINGDMSGTQKPGSMTYSTNQPASFFGYVIGS